MGVYLGWWTRGNGIVGMSTGKYPATWFCIAPSQSLAEYLVEKLNRQRDLNYQNLLNRPRGQDYKADLFTLDNLNPRFSFVSAEGFSLGERASIKHCMATVREDEKPDVQCPGLAILIGQMALAYALDLAKDWPIDEDKELLAAMPAEVKLTGKSDATVTPPDPLAKSNASNNNTGKPRKATINSRMLEAVQKDPDRMGWNSTKWAKHLKCSPPGVVDTDAWKLYRTLREKEKAERALDRHGRGTANQRDRGGESTMGERYQ